MSTSHWQEAACTRKIRGVHEAPFFFFFEIRIYIPTRLLDRLNIECLSLFVIVCLTSLPVELQAFLRIYLKLPKYVTLLVRILHDC